MSSTTNSATPRKPSGSSTHSVGHSPSGSPNPVHTHNGTLNPASANNVFGTMGPSVGLGSINNGWQVWGSASASSTPVSKRTPSMSSTASLNDTAHQTQGPWVPTKSPGKAWDVTKASGNGKEWELDGSPRKKDQNGSDNHSPNGGISFQHTRQRQAAAAQAAAFSSPHKRDDPAARRVVSESEARHSLAAKGGDEASGKMSPSKMPVPFGSSTSPYTPLNPLMPLPGHSNNPYDPASRSLEQTTLGLQNLSVGDGSYDASANGQKLFPQALHGQSGPRGPHPPPQQQRGGFNGYPQQPDYTQYYNGAVAPDPYAEYPSYGYEQYRGVPADPSVYSPNAPATAGQSPYISHQSHPRDLHRAPNGVYYPEFNNVPPPGAQYYYHPPPHQPMMFHPPPQSPMPSPMTTAAGNMSLADKKQYGFQPHMPQPMMMPGIRHGTASPHPQYPEYVGGVPGVVPPGPIYPHVQHGHRALHPHQAYQHQGGRARRSASSVDSASGIRSPLLEEFRSNKSRKWELKDIFTHVVEFSGDQHGSRFIQQKLETASSEDKQMVFDEILPDNILPLITDVFGNYVIQKLFEHGTQVQKTILAKSMEGHVLNLSLQMYGCRVVQKAIEFVLPEQQAALVKELDGQILKCVKDANGNHVIQKLIERVSPDRLPFVASFRGSVYELSTHPYGCRVLQRCFEYLPEPQTRPLLDELQKYTPNLMQDQFGNYVVQFVLEHGSPEDRSAIIAKLKGQMLQMSKHKFASNVCEKALVTASTEDRRTLIEEIMTPKLDGTSPIVIMMKDQFANYVLQRALAIVDESQREALVARIRPQLISMRRYSSAYSKHLISIERLLAEKSNPQGDDAIPEVKITSEAAAISV